MKNRNVILIFIIVAIVLTAVYCCILYASNESKNDADDLNVIFADGVISKNGVFEINSDGQCQFVMIEAGSIYQNGNYMAISNIELDGDILTIYKVTGEEIRCKVLPDSQEKHDS